MKKTVYAIVLAGSMLFPLAPGAQELADIEAELFGSPAADSIDEDELFGADDDDDGIDRPLEASADGQSGGSLKEADDPLDTFLGDRQTRIGGSIEAAMGASWAWNDPYDGSFNALEPDSTQLEPALSSRLILTARPNTSTRYHIALDLKAPFSYTLGALDTVASTPNISVFELFVDRSWGEHLRMRFGKHTVSWGVGYFFSPADVINLGRIDVLDPTAQREGPINLRINIPFGQNHQNIWLYAIAPEARSLEEYAAFTPADIALAGKFEFLAGGFELGAGAYWQRDRAPRAVFTATGALKRFNLFGEAILGWGSDSVLFDSPVGILSSLVGSGPTRETEGLYFKGTLGFLWMGMDSELTIAGQYYYNGEGYESDARNSLIADSIDAINLIPSFPLDTQAIGYLLSGASRHYAGFSISKSQFLVENLTLSLFTMANLADLSGMVQPSASWEFFDGVSLALSPSFIWATSALWGNGANSEYPLLAGGPAMTMRVQAKLGGGRF